MLFMRCGLCVCLLSSLVGCMQALEEQTRKDPNSIIGKTTQNVGEFNPNAGDRVNNATVQTTDPISAPTSVYGVAVERTAQLRIEADLNIFNATEGRYPNSHEEFMTAIIKAGNINLPVLPGGKQYKYDVENHKLVIVEGPAPAASP